MINEYNNSSLIQQSHNQIPTEVRKDQAIQVYMIGYGDDLDDNNKKKPQHLIAIYSGAQRIIPDDTMSTTYSSS